MKQLSIARRYARALLLIGQQDGEIERYRGELASVAALVAGNPALEQAIVNPLYETRARRRVLEALIARMGLSRVMASFLLLLFEKRRFRFLAAIADFYGRLADEAKGIARATLVSAAALPAEALDRIREALTRRTGKEIRLEVREDPALIGGVVTQIGDLVLDGSLRRQLHRMRESFKQGEGV